MSSEPDRRKIKLETRYGSARTSRSRKNRPCDVCRHRKSACVIAVKPPCRFCEIRNLSCTFASNPRPRRLADELPDEDPKSCNEPAAADHTDLSPVDKVSPQASRFPITPASLRRGSDNPSLPSPILPNPQPSRQYLSLQQLTSDAEVVSPSYTPLSVQKSGQSTSRAISLDDDKHRSKNSLEHGKDVTAHFIGLSGEQDANLFSSIRYNVLNETKFIDFNVRRVYVGNTSKGTPPIHFSILHDYFPDRDQRAKKAASDAIETHVGPHGDALVGLYFRFVHPALPVLSKREILKAYQVDRLAIPASLRGVVYGLACAFWEQDPSLRQIFPVTQPELFEHAHAALIRELDSPKLATLQACLLILHEQPDQSGTTESPRIWTLACQATACAQSLGLHQNPTAWKLPEWEKKLRKKLWWTTYFTDIWTSICHGQTPHIGDDSFDTEELTMEDLSSDENVIGKAGDGLLDEKDRQFDNDSATRFLEVIKLTKILRQIIADGFSLRDYHEMIQKTNVASRESTIWRHKLSIERLTMSCPPSHTMEFVPPLGALQVNVAPLHLSIFAARVLVLRALMAPATSESKSDPSSRLCHHFPEALEQGEAFMKFMKTVSKMDLHMFWTRHSRTNLIISGNFLIYLFFCALTESQVAKAYEMLERYRDILRALAHASDWSTIGLIRPSLLRTESFFNGAAEGIRLAGRS